VDIFKRLIPSVFLLTVAVLLVCSCASLKIRVATVSEEPLREYRLQGKERGKVLVIPVRGFISDSPKKQLIGERFSTVQEVVSHLKKAEKDEEIKAVLLEINSPGGTTTASDIIYHEIMRFKEKTKVRIIASLMDVAASGGYYIALPADRIIAHPTSIVGSVGVVFLKPKVMGLMEKLGLAVEVNKSGSEKDIGSPFRPSTAEEQRIFQDLTDRLGSRFLNLVEKHRKMEPKLLSEISAARIYLPQEALRLGLIDRIAYLNDAISEAIALADLPKDAKVVVYRRTRYPDDNLYNTSTSLQSGANLPLIELNFPEIMPALNPGFYYLWMPAAGYNN
jgi:protease-4